MCRIPCSYGFNDSDQNRRDEPGRGEVGFSSQFGGQKSRSSTGLLHYCTFRLDAANDAQNVTVDTARRKDNDQQNLFKKYNVILQRI